MAEGNKTQNLCFFKYNILVANFEDASEQRKIALFLNAAGEEAVEVYNTFNKKFERLEDVVTEFKSYSQARKGTLINTYQFLNIRQNEGEPFEQRVNIMGKKCALGELEERLINMMLIAQVYMVYVTQIPIAFSLCVYLPDDEIVIKI
ncbi:hypothetical protein ACJJTC_003915 [Scirpophaga incertulas]